MNEREIHVSILAWLRSVCPSALVFHVPNSLDMAGDPKTKAIAQARARKLGMLKGAPDLVVLSGGVLVGLEVKREGAYAKPEQKAVGKVLEANGGHWFIVRSIEDAREALRDAGIHTREVLS